MVCLSAQRSHMLPKRPVQSYVANAPSAVIWYAKVPSAVTCILHGVHVPGQWPRSDAVWGAI